MDSVQVRAQVGRIPFDTHTRSQLQTPRRLIGAPKLPDVRIPKPLASTLCRALLEIFRYVPQLYPIFTRSDFFVDSESSL